MRNILVYIRYVGSGYHGYQVQPNGITVQKVLGDVISEVVGHDVHITGVSRTDSGVHAHQYCFNFKTKSDIPCDGLIHAVTNLLPDDIAVVDCREVDEDFHARYSCVSKEYCYLILNTAQRDPFYHNRAYHYRGALDVNEMDRAAKEIVGKFDFSAFRAAGSDTKTSVRTVISAGVTKKGDVIKFTVLADGFLYNMVRIMAGTLIDVGRGKILAEDIKDIINSKDRSRAGATAPACGLYLNKVNY